MLTHDSQPVAPADDVPRPVASPDSAAYPAAETKVRISQVTPEGAATLAGAALGALGLVWVLYERILPFSGVLGFWLMWYAVFLLLYACMARMQWDAREVSHRVALAGFTTGGVLAVLIVIGQVLF